MKRLVAFVLLIVLIISLSACGGNSNVKSKLCNGVWVKQYKGVVFYGDWCTTDIYEFSNNGSFTRYYYEYWALSGSVDEEISTGKYTIDSRDNQIILSYDQSASDNKYYPDGGKYYIPYYVNEYNHELLIEVDSSGNSNYRNYSSKDNISYVW